MSISSSSFLSAPRLDLYIHRSMYRPAYLSTYLSIFSRSVCKTAGRLPLVARLLGSAFICLSGSMPFKESQFVLPLICVLGQHPCQATSLDFRTRSQRRPSKGSASYVSCGVLQGQDSFWGLISGVLLPYYYHFPFGIGFWGFSDFR